MATVRGFIKAKLKRFYFTMEDEELDAILLENDLEGDLEFSKDIAVPVKTVLAGIIPELLLAPDVSQGDFSVKRNIEGIKAYYSLLCGELGIVDVFNPSDYIVQDKSYLWG